MVDTQEIGNTKSQTAQSAGSHESSKLKPEKIKRLDRNMYAEFGNHETGIYDAIVSRITSTIPSQHIECHKWLCFKMGVCRAVDFTGLHSSLQQMRQIITQDKSFYDFEDCS